jgi:hypothetical protein
VRPEKKGENANGIFPFFRLKHRRSRRGVHGSIADMKPTYFQKTRFITLAIVLFAATIGGVVTFIDERVAAAPPAPAQLTDEQFWELSSKSSESDGFFRSDNLLSNELNFQYVIPELLRTAQPGRIYMGVGPEQNFTYIAALKPAMAFIIDIRHGNLDVHLMYKALFEMSANRAEFVSRLFSRKQPHGLNSRSSGRDLFVSYLGAEPSKELYESNLKAIVDHLKNNHKFPLSDGDVEGIDWALSNYYRHGPAIYYNSSDAAEAPPIVGANANFGGRRGGGNYVTYADLMMADDGTGLERSYLATEENFMVLKNLHSKNLLVPVVGDFGGPKAIRAVGKYLKSNGAMVSAFYLSNVEQYLSQDGKTSSFYANVATLPIDDYSRFIRSGGNGGFGGAGGMNASRLGNMLEESRPFAER